MKSGSIFLLVAFLLGLSAPRDGLRAETLERLHIADVERIYYSGPGKLTIVQGSRAEVQANELIVTGSDGAAFGLSGNVDRQVLDLADHGLYQARQLISRSVEARVVGSGAILLQVDDLLDVRLAGAANVRYVGSPFVSQRVSGAGSVRPVAEIII